MSKPSLFKYSTRIQMTSRHTLLKTNTGGNVYPLVQKYGQKFALVPKLPNNRFFYALLW